MIENKKVKADHLKKAEKTEKSAKTEEQVETKAPEFINSDISADPILDTQTEQSEKIKDKEEMGGAKAEENLEPGPGPEPEPEAEMAHAHNVTSAQIAELESEVNELNDKLLRALAETENVRRRAQRDKEDAAKYGIRRFAEDMLSVSDNLGRALSSIDSERRAEDSNLDSIAAGIEIVMKNLLAAFEQSGIQQIEAMGARFDPMLHEAMFEVEDADQSAGTIAQVMEDGFTLHGRTLRAAKVGVTKGGPKATDPGKNETENTNAPGPMSKKEGQKTYETPGDGISGAGSQVDQEL